jgi:hypothetical protein
MDRYLKWESESKLYEGDDDIVILEKVEVLQNMTENGPMKGQRYLKVTWMKPSDCVVFHLQSGKCRMVQYDGKPENKPVWMGEHDRAPVVTAD